MISVFNIIFGFFIRDPTRLSNLPESPYSLSHLWTQYLRLCDTRNFDLPLKDYEEIFLPI